MCFSPCWVLASVEMPQPLLVTSIRIGSSALGRLDQTRQVAKSPSAVPASPPWTMVMPWLLARFWAIAVPGAMENWTSMGEVMGTTFQARMDE
jgi:hypothetical protein